MRTLLHRSRTGFTLIELIIVIAVIAIIAAVVFVAVDPAKRIQASRNARRWSDVTAIVKAIKTFQADNTGTLPAAVASLTATSGYVIGDSVTCASYACNGLPSGITIPSSDCSVSHSTLASQVTAYLKRLPYDPNGGSANDSKYFVNKDANGLITVGACVSEGEGAGGGGTAPVISAAN